MMSTIEENLQKILTAVYGEEVRGAIHDSIAQCYSDTSEGKTLAEAAAEEATEAAGDASDAADEANSAAVAARVYSDAYQDVSDNQIIVETESAAIAHVEDAARAKLKVLEVEIDAVQDLNGYDKPWPAGGGVNILPITRTTDVSTVSGVTFTINRDDAGNVLSISLSGTATNVIVFNVSTGLSIQTSGNSLVLSGCPSGGSASTYYLTAKVSGAWLSSYDTGSGVGLYQTVEIVAIVVQSGVNTNGLVFKPMIADAAVTTYSPYSNICPITGHTSVNVTRAGDASVSATYTLPTEAGTVYGGKLRINEDGSGVLTVTHRLLDPSKFTRNSANADGDGSVFYAGWQQTGAQGAEGAFKSNYLTPYTPASTDYSLLPVNTIRHYGTNSTILICCPGASTTKAQMLEWYQDNGIQILYPLRTDSQITYELTAQQVLSLLKGTNNVYADTGDTAIEYVADTKTYIDNKFAELQALVLENTGESGPGAIDVILDAQSYIVSCTSAGRIRETFTKVFKFEGQVGGERAACTLVSVTAAQIDKGLTVAKQSDGTASNYGYLTVSGTAGQFPFTDSVLHDYTSSGAWTLEFLVNGKQILKAFTVTAVFAGS